MVLIRWDVFFLLWAGMMVFHLVTYFGSQYLEGEPHTVGGALDERIPFHPGWIYIYSSWFVLLLGVPAMVATASPEAKNVKSGTNTASPGPMPHAIMHSSSASVPLPQVMQCFRPT